MHYLEPNKTAGEEARRQLRKNVASNIEQILAFTFRIIALEKIKTPYAPQLDFKFFYKNDFSIK